MNLAELRERLEAAGASPVNYSLGSRPYDGYCLLREGGVWQVFYTERGHDQTPIFSSPDEAAACQFYFDFTMRMRHQHQVAFLRSKPAAAAVREKLAAHGVATTQYELYYAAPDDYRQQVFVEGTDIFAARRILGSKLPLEDGANPNQSWWEQLRQLFR